ncbi:MAG: dephospho-CoA kinase [Thiomicrorhabdus sp.]|nr:MAG: dephospho-CoA kinase [Thiomicrorhabdus sp.]
MANSNALDNKTIKTIGLTGGIGSGKSTLSELFTGYGIPTIDTDLIAREVVQANSVGLNAIIKQFGHSILNENHTLDRAKLREIIFNDATAKHQLEAMLHPLIQAETQHQIVVLKETKEPKINFILVAIPLLTETIQKRGGKPDYLDEVWVIDTTVEQQLAHASQRDGASPELIQKIIDQQASRQARRDIADRVIDNRGELEQLKQQVKLIVEEEKNQQ